MKQNPLSKVSSCFTINAVLFIAALVFGVAQTSPGFLPVSHADATMVPMDFTALAEKATPTVVNIRTLKTLSGGGPVFRHFFRGPRGRQDHFEDFFERFFGDEQQREHKQRSLGSGFIIDEKGFIVTNNHVIEDADEIRVKLKNGNEHDAEIIGRDPNTDLALIKITADVDLPYMKLGDSDTVKVGEWVMAIGNPFGLENTVTTGIVSAKGRVIGSGPYDDFIQTDASINPGNSGGPLINMEGEVVGINTAIVATGQGIGFAVPVNMAKNILQQLRDKGEVTRGWIGVVIQDLTEELADYYGVDSEKGALVAEVIEDDPADRAGIKAKDVIIEINGKSVEDSRDLSMIVAGFDVGEEIDVTVIRNGKQKTFDVTIAKREEDKIASRRGFRKEQEEVTLGIRVSQLTTDLVRRFNLADEEGVVVVGVASGSKGDEAGVMVGDIIKEVNHQSIRTTEDFRDAIREVRKDETIQMFIKRIRAGFIVIKLTK